MLLTLPAFGDCFTNTVLGLLSWFFPSLCPQGAIPLKHSPSRAPRSSIVVTVMSWDTTNTEWLCFPKTGLLAGRGKIWLQGSGERRHRGFEQGFVVQYSKSLLSRCLLILFVYLASLLALQEPTLSGYVVSKGQCFLTCFPILFSPSSP